MSTNARWERHAGRSGIGNPGPDCSHHPPQGGPPTKQKLASGGRGTATLDHTALETKLPRDVRLGWTDEGSSVGACGSELLSKWRRLLAAMSYALSRKSIKGCALELALCRERAILQDASVFVFRKPVAHLISHSNNVAFERCIERFIVIVDEGSHDFRDTGSRQGVA